MASRRTSLHLEPTNGPRTRKTMWIQIAGAETTETVIEKRLAATTSIVAEVEAVGAETGAAAIGAAVTNVAATDVAATAKVVTDAAAIAEAVIAIEIVTEIRIGSGSETAIGKVTKIAIKIKIKTEVVIGTAIKIVRRIAIRNVIKIARRIARRIARKIVRRIETKIVIANAVAVGNESDQVKAAGKVARQKRHPAAARLPLLLLYQLVGRRPWIHKARRTTTMKKHERLNGRRRQLNKQGMGPVQVQLHLLYLMVGRAL